MRKKLQVQEKSHLFFSVIFICLSSEFLFSGLQLKRPITAKFNFIDAANVDVYAFIKKKVLLCVHLSKGEVNNLMYHYQQCVELNNVVNNGIHSECR